MKNAILLHGKPGKDEYYDPDIPSASNFHWFPWLQKQLLVRDIAAHTPEVPNAWKPHYPTWQKEFERFDVAPDTVLVGHSAGGGFIVRWLSEHKDVRVGKVVLVAPSLGMGWGGEEFFECEIDPDLTARTKGLVIFNSDNDETEIQQAVKVLRFSVRNIKYKEFSGYGHFCMNDLGTEKFPELLEELL